MPSPAVTANTAPQIDSNSTKTADNASQQSVNGFSTSSQDEITASTDAPSTRNPVDVIREGKEKAKAVMAASASDSTSATGPATASTSTGEDGVITNGQLQSRKRSRSGSRKPLPVERPRKDRIPADTPAGERELAQIREREALYSVAIHDHSERIRHLYAEKHGQKEYYENLVLPLRRQNPAQIFGYGYAGFGNGTTNKTQVLIYPQHKPRLGKRRARKITYSRKDGADQADQLEELVPIRLDIEHDKLKLRDSFTWNLHERVTRIDLFAENLVEDFNIPPEHIGFIIQQVNAKMQEQITEFYPHVFIEEEPLDPHLAYTAYKNDEMRILIKLHITIGPHTLIDQFEWEINNPLNNPEEFARQMTKDLSLSGEFATAIAHQMREQSQMFTKSLYIVGHPFDGRPVEDPDVHDQFLPTPLTSVFRPAQIAKEYTPYFYELSEAELQREELSILRDQRRQKRSTTRRGGPALPDLKDRERTVRTLVVSSVIPGAADSMDTARVFKTTRSSGRSRRTGAGRADGGEESEESEEEESENEAEIIQPMGGTARTRGIRGAATAAQAAMRAGFGRSTTPDLGTPHHHETRVTARRSGVEVKEDSTAEPTSLIVKLRIGKAKLRQWLENRNKPSSGRSATSTPQPGRQSVPAHSMPPPPSPLPAPRSAPGTDASSSVNGQQWKYSADGRVDAPYPLAAGQAAAPPPPWITTALTSLGKRYANDSFEAQMIYRPVDRETGAQIKPDKLPPAGSPLPPHIKYQWLPRIKCHDCPGKLYTAGPENTVDNFEIHLKNRVHKERVEQRRRG